MRITAILPEWLQVNFNGPKSITQAIVYSVQDQYWAPSEPTDTMTFNNYGLVNFAVQGWDGSAWVTLATVSGNNLVKRTVNFSAFTTDRVRVLVTAAADGYSRMTELEVFGIAVAAGADGFGSQRVQWLRGNSANEAATCGTCTPSFRSRPTSKLGDIIHSAPSYVAAPCSAYPDSHGRQSVQRFRDGQREPSGDDLRRRQRRHAARFLGHHRPGSDGVRADVGLQEPERTDTRKLVGESRASRSRTTTTSTGRRPSGDVYYGGSWHTLLAERARRAEGRASSCSTSPTRAPSRRRTPSSIVRWEFSDANDADMGYSFSQPLLVKTNNGRWSVIVGNGYNNSEDDGKREQQRPRDPVRARRRDRRGGGPRSTPATGSTGTPNGLSGPIAIDTNGDGIADVVYAGDLNGNLWKFDLSVVQRGSVERRASAARRCSRRGQPITVRPDVTRFTHGGYLVTFGTGRYVDVNDGSTTATQSFYGIRDVDAAVSGVEPGAAEHRQQQRVRAATATRIASQHARGRAGDARYAGLRRQRDLGD